LDQFFWKWLSTMLFEKPPFLRISIRFYLRLKCGYARPINPTYDDLFQRIPLVVTVDLEEVYAV